MKYFFLILISASLLLLACTKSKNDKDGNVFSLEVSNLKNIDTLFINSFPDMTETYKLALKNGFGKIKIPVKSDYPRLFTITTNFEKSDLNVFFYVETGDGHFSSMNDGVRGTSGNNAIANDIKETQKIVRKIDPENKWWKIQLKKKNNIKITSEDKEIFKKLNEQFSKVFTKEKAMLKFTNSIGKAGESYFLYQLLNTSIMTDDEKFNIISKASKSVNIDSIKKSIENRKLSQKGKKYIDFNAVYLSEPNKSTNLSNLLKNNKKFTVIDFWASWCHPCIESLPSVKALYKKYDQKANFINVAVMDKDIKKLQKISNEKGISWINLYDQGNLVPDKYAMDAIPTTILLDKNGIILLRTHDIMEIERFLK